MSVEPSAEKDAGLHAELMEAMLASWDDEPNAAEIELCSVLATNVLPVVNGTKVRAWRDAADKVETGPTFPLLPSIISALLREHADALEAHYATRVIPPVVGHD